MERIETKPELQASANKYGKPVFHVIVIDSYTGMRGDCEEQCATTDKREADAWAKQWKSEYDKDSGYKIKRATYEPQDLSGCVQILTPIHPTVVAEFKVIKALDTGLIHAMRGTWKSEGFETLADCERAALRHLREPVFVMTASARRYAVELQGLSATVYMQGRVMNNSAQFAEWWEMDQSRDCAIAKQLEAARLYSRMVGVMGLAD